MTKKSKKHSHPPAAHNAAAPAGAPRWMAWGYTAGGLLCFAGVVVLSIALGVAFRTASRGMHKAVFPGVQEFSKLSPGLYMGIYQPEGEKAASAADLQSLEISLASSDSLMYLPVARTGGMQVSLGRGAPGMAFFQFDIPEKGDYRLEAQYTGLASTATIPVLLVHENLQNNRADIAVGALLCAVFCAAGLYVLIQTRRRAQRGNF
jgi:hypothetical protein